MSLDRPARFNLTTLEPMLEDVHERLSGVVIECLEYGSFIERYDREETLFYLDPPYWGSENDYGKAMFSPDDFEHLAGQMRRLKGKALMSINDVPEIRELFAGPHLAEVKTSYTVGRETSGREKARELLISTLPISPPVVR